MHKKIDISKMEIKVSTYIIYSRSESTGRLG